MKHLAFLFILLNLTALGQESQFSQYFESWPLTNPAIIGTIPTISFSTNYKRGGNSETENYLELIQGTFSYPFKKVTSKEAHTGSAAVTFFKESRGFQGIYSSQKVLMTGAYSMQLSNFNNQSLIFALQGGVGQNRLSDSNLRWGSQYNPFLGDGFDGTLNGEDINTNPFTYPIFNFGVVYSAFDNENYYIRDKSLIAGISVDNLNKPRVGSGGLGDRRLPRLYKAFGSLKLPLSGRWYIHPSSYLLYSKGSTQINGGLSFSSMLSSVRAQNAVKLIVGSWYRVGDSVIVLMGVDIENFRVGGSVDLNTNSIGQNNELGSGFPTYEVSITYKLVRSSRISSLSNPIF